MKYICRSGLQPLPAAGMPTKVLPGDGECGSSLSRSSQNSRGYTIDHWSREDAQGSQHWLRGIATVALRPAVVDAQDSQNQGAVSTGSCFKKKSARGIHCGGLGTDKHSPIEYVWDYADNEILPIFVCSNACLDEEVRQLKRARIGKHHDLCRNAAHWRLVVVGYDDRDRLFLQAIRQVQE